MSDATLFTFGMIVFLIAGAALILYGYTLFWAQGERDRGRV